VIWPTDKIKWNIQLEHLKYEGLNLISKSLIYIQLVIQSKFNTLKLYKFKLQHIYIT
jgi:hypothetical protein